MKDIDAIRTQLTGNLMSDTLDEIRKAIGNFDTEHARNLIRDELQSHPSAELYYLASQVALNDDQKQGFLQKALDLDPFHVKADAALKKLNRYRGEDSDAYGGGYSSESPFDYGEEKPKRDAGSAGMQQYELADTGTRFIALIIDYIITFIIGFIVLIIISSFMPPPDPSDYVNGELSRDYQSANQQFTLVLLGISIVLTSIYHIYFLTHNDGQTPGKSAMKIKIVKLNGRKLTGGDAFIRNVIGYAISGLFLWFGFIWAAFDQKNQTWHDKMANTVVVKTRQL
jgi:uncharacterized RDD family membrane protein YckC